MDLQNQNEQNPVKEEDNDHNYQHSTEVQLLKRVRHRRLALELECEVFTFLQLPIQHKFIWGMGRGIYGLFGQKILAKTKRLANPKGNGWDRRKSPQAIISRNGLNVSDTAMNEWHYIFADKGFVISEAKSLNANFPRKIFYYFEVTQTKTTPQCSFYYIGLSHGAIPATKYAWDCPEFYIFSTGPHYAYDYCWIAEQHHRFQWPNGAIRPEWIKGPGNVLGCGLLLNPENKLFIFFTGNGILMGKPIPISPSVDCLFPTVDVLSSSLEVNFGDNLAEKPFKFDYNKCLGFDL